MAKLQALGSYLLNNRYGNSSKKHGGSKNSSAQKRSETKNDKNGLSGKDPSAK